MKAKHFVVGVIAVLVLGIGVSIFSQVNRPYHNGGVWNIAFIRMKPGMETAYMNYLAGSWKGEREALKKEGLIVSYKVISLSRRGHARCPSVE